MDNIVSRQSLHVKVDKIEHFVWQNWLESDQDGQGYVLRSASPGDSAEQSLSILQEYRYRSTVVIEDRIAADVEASDSNNNIIPKMFC